MSDIFPIFDNAWDVTVHPTADQTGVHFTIWTSEREPIGFMYPSVLDRHGVERLIRSWIDEEPSGNAARLRVLTALRRDNANALEAAADRAPVDAGGRERGVGDATSSEDARQACVWARGVSGARASSVEP